MRPYAPSTQQLGGGKRSNNEIGGRDRHKFFRRPVVGGLSSTAQQQGGVSAATPSFAAGPYANSERGVPIPQHQHYFSAPQPTQAQQQRWSNSAPATKRKAPQHTNKQSLSPMQGAGGEYDELGHFHPSTSSARVAAAGASGTSVSSQRDHHHQHHQTQFDPNAPREFSTQTLMRENDCQTDPFTPEYVFEAGKNPEVYALRELKWGEGLPARQSEIEMIDRIQRRRDVEANIPRGNDDNSVKQRLHALEGLEKAEWAEREEHIQMLQEERLGKIQQALSKRELRREEQTRQRVESFKDKKLYDVEHSLRKLQDTRFNVSRRLGRQHDNPTAEKHKKDTIINHASFGPNAEAVKTSSALRTNNPGTVENIHANYDVRPTLLSFAEGIQELERTKCMKLETLSENLLKAPTNKAVSSLSTKYRRREANAVLQHLDYAQELIDERKTVKKDATESVQELYRATPRIERPPTPTLGLEDDAEEEKEEAIMLLQRLIRGRAVQNDFYEGKERCHGLIEELQAASSAATSEPLWLPQQQAERLAEQQMQAVDRVIEEAEGDIIFATVDYLHKELLRLQEAAKIDALRRTAQEARDDREKVEAERRQAERERRAEDERVHDTVLRAVDSTSTTFLDQLVRNTVHVTAQRQAIEEQQAKTIWGAYRRPHQFSSQFDPSTHSFPTKEARESFVCNLLDGTVFPTVCIDLRGDPTRRAENERAVAESAIDAVMDVTKSVAKV